MRRPQGNERNYWACPAGIKKDSIEVPSFRREYVEPGGSEGQTASPIQTLPRGCRLRTAKKKDRPLRRPLLDVFDESIPRSTPSASSKKYPDHWYMQSKSLTGVLPSYAGGRHKKGQAPPRLGSTHCPSPDKQETKTHCLQGSIAPVVTST